MKPNPKNFCGGNFQDWLEVNLIEKCNGKCSWCIEQNGYHPTTHAPWQVIASQALASGKLNIILLGGEPTLYPYLKEVIQVLSINNRKVWITTNGSLLSLRFDPRLFVNSFIDNLRGITGINISIHDYDLNRNKDITGILIKDLKSSIKQLHDINASVRLNCNCLAGHIDSKEKINNYIKWAKEIGADTIRFAELKQDDKAFVDLAKILNYQYGLTDDPFVEGCHCNAIINDMPVNFRQMCGLQTTCRKKPIDPIQYAKQVLYYDGNFYKGWQSQNKGETSMTDKELANLLRSVESGLLTSEEAFAKIKSDPSRKVETIKYVERDSSSYGCHY